MSSYIFDKFEADILNEYEKINGTVNKTNLSELSRASIVCNSILLDLCHSFYFKDLYSGFKLVEGKDNNDNSYHYIAAPFYQERKKMTENDKNNLNNYLIKNGLFLKEIDTHCHFLNRNFIQRTIDNSQIEVIKKNLRKDEYYNLLLEDNSIKQKLILKSKDELSITIINGEMTLDKFHEMIKEQNIKNPDTLKDYMLLNCGMNFINFDKQKNNIWVIVHNQNEIAGIANVMNDPFIHEIPDADNFKYLGYITVNYSFRGKGLGTLISDKIMEYCADNNFIYKRSSATNDGELYMEKKIDVLSKKYEDRLPIIKTSHSLEMSDYIHKLFTPKGQYETARHALLEKIKILNSIEQENGKLLKSDLKKILKLSSQKRNHKNN